MKTKPHRSDDVAGLRRRAEAHWHERQAGGAPPRTDADTQRLLHELEVHQIELEMQNAELQRARGELEVALEKITDLYDFAPVGYFSIDQHSLIREANLTGAAMLGVARSRLHQRRLRDFIAPASRPPVEAFLKTVFAGSENQACEALIVTATGTVFLADLRASSVGWFEGEQKWCRLTVSDIGAIRQGQEAQRRVASLAAANLEANREIARRRAVEASLKESERKQRELLEDSRELHAQLRRLTHQILLAQEEERRKISRQLHDEISQILVGINVQLETLAQTAVIRPGDLRKRIGKTGRLVEQSIDVVHRFARNLRPTMLDDLGLIPALSAFAKELSGRNNLRIRFTAFAGVEALDSSRRTVLYRVAQEALTNVARHAHARRAYIRILKIRGAVRLEIHDDGKSFPATRTISAMRRGRLGLLGMRERVEMFGGRFAIASAPGKGTTVTAEIPFDSPPPS